MKIDAKQLNNIESIIREQLVSNKYTGLYNDVDSCCCDLSDDFMDCSYAVLTGPHNCRPGIRRKIKTGDNGQGYIVRRKRGDKK